MWLRSVSISTFLLILTPINNSSDDKLPRNECHCRYDEGIQKADCSLRGLNQVPVCVPNTTLDLNLGSNSIECRPGQFERFKALKSLVLSGNSLDNLIYNFFAGLTELRVLTLTGCDMISLRGYFFNGLSKLSHLYLDLNYISELSKDSFSTILNLTYLDLSYNKITYIKDNIFSGLSKLIYLDLSRNPSSNSISDEEVKCMRFGSRSFTGLSSLKYLSLNYVLLCNATSFPVDVFKPLLSLEKLDLLQFCLSYDDSYYNCPNLDQHLSNTPSLQQLHIDTERISQLGPGFGILKNLQEIMFTTTGDNEFRIETLSNYTFENLKDIQVSRLILDKTGWDHVAIDSVMPFTFSIIKTLKELDFSFKSVDCDEAFNNIFIGLEKTMITHLKLSVKCAHGIKAKVPTSLRGTKLETLDLSYSSLASIQDGKYFNQLPKTLNHIFLQYNMIERMDFSQLHTLEQLLFLDFSHQTHESVLVKRTTRNDFQSSETTDQLSSTFTSKKSVTEYGAKEHQRCFPLPVRLHTIDISYSPLLSDISEVVCDSNNSLKSLDVSNQYWHPWVSPSKEMLKLWKSLKFLPKLEELNLSGNQIKHIPMDAFSGQHALKRLIIHNNVLSNVSFDITNLVNLQTLDLSDNVIRFVSGRFTDQLEKLADSRNLTVNLDGNNLVCDCDSVSFVKWMRDTKVIHKKDCLSCAFINGSQASLGQVAVIYEKLKLGCANAITVINNTSLLTVGCITGVLLFVFIFVIVYHVIKKLRRRKTNRQPEHNILLTYNTNI